MGQKYPALDRNGMRSIKAMDDKCQLQYDWRRILLNDTSHMIFSKSFGYSLRGILYVAATKKSAVPLDDMSQALGVPRHFMGKIMKRLVQQNILSSLKGPAGGFFLNETTLERLLIDVYRLTDRPEELEQCVLSRGPCNSSHRCRLHDKVLPLKAPLTEILYHTTIGELLAGDKESLIRSLTSVG